jgi:D-beta-D-heptose 7-phosphate kinase/D-beta-D-heptose 1-phosphate adenosyltransferase
MSPSTKKKVLSPEKAALWIKKLQKNGEKIVFTNGCFDLLHAGHITYLEEARNLGDGLVVALNGDASVKKLKGPTRPLNTLKDRMRVIAALECVSCVTWFPQETPVSLVKKLQPKIYVKGGDWDISKIPEYAVVKSYGGKAIALSFVKGKSTTKIIKKAKNSL